MQHICIHVHAEKNITPNYILITSYSAPELATDKIQKPADRA